MENQIYITHFSNPHKFWYKPFYPGSKTRQFKQMQDAIDEYCEQHYMAQDIVDYEPIYGEVVAYFEPSLARWTRCSVVGIKEEDKRMRSYRLWLIDEGYPKVVDMEHLKPLPEEFQDMSTSTVKQAALKNILPAHCVYDPQREEFRKAICLSWNENANTMIQSLIKETQKICFTNVSPYPMGNRLIDFGDLLIYTNSKTFNAADVLSQWTLGLIVDFETYMNLIFERKAMLCSQTSSLCSEPLNDSGSLEITVKTPKQYFCTNEVNERLFDESASMVGVMMKQPAVVDAMRDKSEANSNLFTTTSQSAGKTDAEVSETDTKMSRLRQKMQLQMAQKMKYTPVKGSEEQTPVKPVVQSTISSTMLCKTTTKHLQEDNHILDPLSRIRMSPQSLTIDVAQSTQAEYDLMHTESKKPALPQSYTASEHDTPPLVKINNNQTSAGSGTAPKFMRKITKVKANLNQQKHIAPVAAQSPPRKMVFAPAGVQISSLLTPEKMPTSESNGALKRFEKVIQDEKW